MANWAVGSAMARNSVTRFAAVAGARAYTSRHGLSQAASPKRSHKGPTKNQYRARAASARGWDGGEMAWNTALPNPFWLGGPYTDARAVTAAGGEAD